MSEYEMPPSKVAKIDAIDVNDFVYAATGVRVRRLTMPDGTHWFPAADVAGELGYANTRDAIAKQVPGQYVMGLEDLARSVAQSDAWRKIAVQGLKKSMRMVNLQGLIMLVNACTKPEAEPFKRWVTEVIIAVQRGGSYALGKTEVPPAADNAMTGYIIPIPLADAMARLEERSIRLDEQFTAEHQERMRIEEQLLDVHRQMLAVQHMAAQAQQESATALQHAARALKDVAVAQLCSVEVHKEQARTLERVSASMERQTGSAQQPVPHPRQPDLGCPMEIVDAMSWHEFEEYVARLLRRDGCTEVHVSGRRGDLGADIVGRAPDGRRLVVQCKHYAPHRTVPNADMQKFVGTALLEYQTDLALFVATCAFTPAALELAQRRGITVVARPEFRGWNEGTKLNVL